jgi:uncharacterized protein (TIGR03435 family)
MMRVFAGITVAAFLSVSVFGQSPETPPRFDIVDVHESVRSTNPNMTGGALRGGRYELRRATMVDLIRTAYGVDADSVIGGPNWLESDRFDVIAKAPSAASQETARLMLQSVLADRFKLVVHLDTKPMPAFVLRVGKGKPKLKESDAAGSAGCQRQPQTPQPGVIPYNVFSCRHVTMDAFARRLREMAGDYMSVPVVDATGLEGFWDFELKWTFRAALSRAGSDGINIFDALDKQLGLKLESEKAPAPVVVVDSVNEKPTANPPDVATALPPGPPLEFEVADIKPSMPGARPNGRFQNGRIDVQALPLKNMIRLAWDINSEEMVAPMPKWVDSAKFDIVAKAPDVGPENQPDFEALRLMLRALLVDRFKMKIHMEERPVTSYTLVAVKPKLQRADPSNRTRCKEGPPSGAKDARDTNPILSRLLTCQNTTMAQFADRLQSLAPGYIHTPVVDGTELEGAWDFTLSFSAAGLLQNAGKMGEGSGPQADGTGATSDPNGAVTLFEAINKQLGLKLESQKRPYPVLVIDHIEEKPTDN